MLFNHFENYLPDNTSLHARFPKFRNYICAYFRVAIRIQSGLSSEVTVLDLASWVRIAVLMNVYLGLGNSGGLGFWNKGYMSQGREMDGLVYKQPEDKVDGSYHSKEGSK